jgi:hypothetical protein
MADNAFLSAQGYAVDEQEPPGVGLAGFGFLALIVAIPVLSAAWFGLRASRAGQSSGTTAALLALTVGGGLVLAGFPVYLARILGWPVVLAWGGVLLVAVVTLWRQGHQWPPTLGRRRTRRHELGRHRVNMH